MKRAAGSEFDDDGVKWFQSPHYKEVKTDMVTEDNSKGKDYSKRIPNDHEKESKLKSERFYDLFTRVTRSGDFKLDSEELNSTLNIRVDEIPDTAKIPAIFEELNSKSAVVSRGKKNWSEQETIFCIWIVIAYCHLSNSDYNDLNDKDWESIARIFPGKTSEQCKTRWQGLLKVNLTKAPWTHDEDQLLMQIIQEKGPKKWKEIAYELNKKMEPAKVFRQGKQCRERWINHLDPAINRGVWTNDEDVRLLETHLTVGKKWAEIAKIMKNRTENAVKNRWNSLMKKYKGEYGMDFDSLSTSSVNSNRSMEDLEKKIAEMIITNRRKHGKDSNSPDTLINEQIQEMPEEESPGYYSDFSLETATKTEDTRSVSRKEDEMRPELQNTQKKGGSKKKPTSVSMAKNNLRDLVTEEMHNHTQNFQPTKSNSTVEGSVIGNDQQMQDTAQRVYMFGNNNGAMNNSGYMQDQNMSNQGFNPSPAMMINQYQKDRPNLFNMAGVPGDMFGLNLSRNYLNNFGIFAQSPQQNPISPGLFGLYNQQGFNQQANFNLAPASLPASVDGFQQNKAPLNQYIGQQMENEAKKANEQKSENEQNLQKSYKLDVKYISQFNMNELPTNNNLYYAVVDLSGGQMYLIDQAKPENYPPIIQNRPKNIIQNQGQIQAQNQNQGQAQVQGQNQAQGQGQGQSAVNSLTMVESSPALNGTSWTSPPLNTATLMNYPLFNNPFAFTKNQFSPNINFFQESPKLDGNLFGTTPKMESGEWTPETMNRPLFSSLGMKQRVGLLNSRGDTPEDTGLRIGSSGGAFRRMNDNKGKMMTGSTNEGGLKYSSPSSFLQSSQSNNMQRGQLSTIMEKI